MAASKSARRWWLLLIPAALLLAAWQFGWLQLLTVANLKVQQQALNGWVSANSWLAAGVFFVVYVAGTAASLPGAAVMTLAGGALFGLVEGTLLVSFASAIGATGAFLISRYLFRDSLRKRYGKRLKGFDDGIARDGAFYLFSLRLVPAVPYVLVNLIAGLTSLGLFTFYWVSQLGMLPGTFAFVYAGTQLATVEKLSDVLSLRLIGAFVLLGLLPLLLRWIMRWIKRHRVYAGHRKPDTFDYNLIVIGAGSGGLVAAYLGNALKAKVALIERAAMGGDCLNTGCVPSKTLIRSARALADAENSAQFGIARMQATFEFAQVMQHVRDTVGRIAPHDSVERYRALGVDVMTGDARIVSPWEVEVDGRRLSARSLIVATGARPTVPSLPGVESIEVLTSDNVWQLRELPSRLVVLGGGPIGCELGQCFARFGSQVTIVEKYSRLLVHEDADAAAVVEDRLRAEGIVLATRHTALRVESLDGQSRLVCVIDGSEIALPFDRLLIALGRTPTIEGFGLRELGIEINPHNAVDADAAMRTNFPNILVCGDVTSRYQFTHVASEQGWHAAVNGLLTPWWSLRLSQKAIPWATFTSPELARVGLSEDEAREQDVAFEVSKFAFSDSDRAVTDAATEGFVKVLTVPGKDTLLGACIVGEHAGELLAEFVLAMRHGLGLGKVLSTIHIYPTLSEANKRVAGEFKRAHASQRLLGWAQQFHAWRRGG